LVADTANFDRRITTGCCHLANPRTTVHLFWHFHDDSCNRFPWAF